MICPKCNNDKPEKNFPSEGHKGRDGALRRSKICRSCKREKMSSNGKCQCGRPLVTKSSCAACRDRNNKYSCKERLRRKIFAINRYGGCCVFCRESEVIFLTIDHTDDNGAAHRRKEGIATGSQTYKWLEANNYPEGFQVACFNCNAAKAQIGADKLRELLASKRNHVLESKVIDRPG